MPREKKEPTSEKYNMTLSRYMNSFWYRTTVKTVDREDQNIENKKHGNIEQVDVDACNSADPL